MTWGSSNQPALSGPASASGHTDLAMATRVLLLRHGQSTWNAEGRWQGWADPPLTELGEKQALDAVPALSQLSFNVIVTSDLRRAQRTSDILSEGLRIATIRTDPGLRERSMGDWTGLTTSEIELKWPDATKGRNIGVEALPPGGEAPGRFPERVKSALRRLATDFPEQRVLGIAHGAVIQMLDEQLGLEPLALIDALGGRWYDVTADEIVPMEPFSPQVPAPTTEDRTL